MFRLDELMALLFIDGYDENSKIIHINGDYEDCKLSNLKIYDVINYINDIVGDTSKWVKIHTTEYPLYYDYYISEYGKIFNGTTFSMVEPFYDLRNKYPCIRVGLYVDKMRRVNFTISRLVAEMFIPNHSDDKTLVYFKDNNHTNLHYSNIAWGNRDDILNNAIINSKDKDELYDEIAGNEKWVNINIDEELMYDYEISNFGRVYNKTNRKLLSLSRGSGNLNNQSWIFANLRLADGTYKKFLVHRLVAMHFVKNRDPINKIYVNHINGNPECNMYFNLEWCTAEENAFHALSTNLLHSQKFDFYANDDEWRTRSILSWILSMNGLTMDNKYRFYVSYVNKYEPELTILTTTNFKNFHKNNYNIDNDYTKLFDFYQDYYVLDMSSTTRES